LVGCVETPDNEYPEVLTQGAAQLDDEVVLWSVEVLTSVEDP